MSVGVQWCPRVASMKHFRLAVRLTLINLAVELQTHPSGTATNRSNRIEEFNFVYFYRQNEEEIINRKKNSLSSFYGHTADAMRRDMLSIDRYTR